MFVISFEQSYDPVNYLLDYILQVRYALVYRCVLEG